MKIRKIEDLNNIPEGITELDISRLGLTTLPKLPQSLTTLYCSENQLTSLDIAHCYYLQELEVEYNNFPEEMVIILDDEDLTIQEKINKLIKGCLIPNDNSYVLK